MTKRKVTKQAKRRLTILTPLVILAVGYLLFTMVTTGIQLYKLHHEEKELKEELKDLKGNSEELKTEITKLQDKDYIARYARENYLYTKDGEYVIKVPTDEKKKEKQSINIDKDYIVYGAAILILLIILHLIRKSHKKKRKK